MQLSSGYTRLKSSGRVFKRRAIALISGGLDSALAALLIKEQGVDVIGLYLSSPFACRNELDLLGKTLAIPILTEEKGDPYLQLVAQPRFGYGRNMNPCVDCRIFMFQKASEVMQREGAHFIITGEVVGQRPLSQLRAAMDKIEKESGLMGLIVRPLSGQLLPETLPEKEGWISRANLLGIHGRGRSSQLALAEKLKLVGYSSPAGGCLLTDAHFSHKLRDWYQFGGLRADASLRSLHASLLRVGRHFRINPSTKIVVARNDSENHILHQAHEKQAGSLVTPIGFMGPLALIQGETSREVDLAAGQLVGHYSRKGTRYPVSLEVKDNFGHRETVAVAFPPKEEELNKWSIALN